MTPLRTLLFDCSHACYAPTPADRAFYLAHTGRSLPEPSVPPPASAFHTCLLLSYSLLAYALSVTL